MTCFLKHCSSHASGPSQVDQGAQGTKRHSLQSTVMPAGTQLGRATRHGTPPQTPAMWLCIPNTRTHGPGEWVLLHDTASQHKKLRAWDLGFSAWWHVPNTRNHSPGNQK